MWKILSKFQMKLFGGLFAVNAVIVLMCSKLSQRKIKVKKGFVM